MSVGVGNDAPFELDVSDNYWGTTNRREIANKIVRDQGEASPLASVRFEPFLQYPDSDLDGLKDFDEKKNRTNPNIMDTDMDGCIDGLEVNQYKTNPLNPDTDGDGIPDGIEVFRKTNPLDPRSFPERFGGMY